MCRVTILPIKTYCFFALFIDFANVIAYYKLPTKENISMTLAIAQ